MRKSVLVFFIFIFIFAGCSNVNKKDSRGRTNFMKIVETGRESDIKKALKDGANINEKDKEGVTALMLAAEKCDIDTVRLLIQRGADINAVDNSGYSVVKHAKRRQYNDEVIELLLKYGAKE